MPLLVRSTQSSPVLFAKRGMQTVTWAPVGDPMGDDVQLVSNEVAEDVDFIKSVTRGLLVIEEAGSSEDVHQRVRAQQEAYAGRARQQQSAVEQTIDRRQDRDLIQLNCIAPNGSGREGVCGATVLVRSAERSDVPPLCPAHEGMSDRFFLAQSGSRGEGEAAANNREGAVSQQWKPITMTAPVRQ